MGKRKRKSRQKRSLLSSPSPPPDSAATRGEPKAKKRVLTLPPKTGVSTSQTQPRQDTSQMVTCPPQVNNKLWNRFYEPLILLSAYGKSQGSHVKADEAPSEGYVGGGNKTLRKNFLDQLAYICDYSPSGDTVAAIAIQDGPQLVYWVAANTSQGSKIKPFLADILQLLGQGYGASKEGVFALKLQVSDRVTAFSAQKLRRYRFMLKRTIKTCLPMLETQNTEEANSLKKWLISLSDSDLDPLGFCRLCYEARDSEFLEAVQQRSKEGSIREDDTSYRARYARIRHFIGRIGSFMKTARVLVEAGKHYPKLFTDYSIEIAAHRPNFTPPPYRQKSSINGIINRMVTDPQACEYYQKELHSQDEKFHLMLEKRIRDEYKDPKLKLRTHAELILLDLFHRKDLRFLDGIQYIGVSKPTCFLCHRYFLAHPLQVQTSGCSNNLYLQWQPPYVLEDSSALVKEQEDILQAMIKGIRLFVLDKIVPGYRGVRPHPDSTTGLGTSVHTDIVGAPPPADTSHTDSHHATSTLPQPDKDTCSLGEAAPVSDGDIEDFIYGPSSWNIAEFNGNSDEDSDEAPEDGGVPLI